MGHTLGYLVLVLGVAGVAAGLIGLLLPNLRGRVPSLRLPSLPRFGQSSDEEVESLIAELERAGFRQSPFEAASTDPAPMPNPLASAELFAKPPAPLAEAASPFPPVELEDDEDAFVPPATVGRDDEDELLPREALEDLDGDEAIAAEEPAESEDEGPKVVKLEDAPSSDLLALFDEKTEYHAAATAVRAAIEDVTIGELLKEAQQLRQLIGSRTKSPPAA